MLSSQERQNTNIWSGGPRIFICNMFIPSNMIDIEVVLDSIKIKQFKKHKYMSDLDIAIQLPKHF